MTRRRRTVPVIIALSCIVVLAILAILFFMSCPFADKKTSDPDATVLEAVDFSVFPDANTAVLAAMEEASQTIAAKAEETRDVVPSHIVTNAELWSLPAQSGLYGFTFNESDAGAAPEVPAEYKASIDALMGRFASEGSSVGFIFMDLASARGFAYNIDERFYSASSIKGPFMAFLCEEYVETGGASYGSIEDLIARTIVDSDNNAYDSLRRSYTYDGTFASWLSRLGLSTSDYITGGIWYPDYSAREASILWLDIWDYLQGGSGYAEWLSGLYSNTNLSPLRDALGERGTVMNKAGWIGEPGYNAIADNGIVYFGKRPYLVSVLTDFYYSDHNYSSIVELIRAIAEGATALK